MRRWESLLEKYLKVRANYAQCAFYEIAETLQPARLDTYVAMTSQGEVMRLRWQLPNSYIVKRIKTHRHRGQSKKVRKVINHQLQQPVNLRRDGLPVCKLYFDKPKSLQDYLKHYDGIRYLWRGENHHRHGIFEATDRGWGETMSKERVSFRYERYIKQKGELRLSAC